MVDLIAAINTRQLEILSWIADGCPDGVMHDYTYKATAVALQNRRLVKISRNGGTWMAELTEAGAYYLQHGVHPDRLRPATRRPSATAARTVPRSQRIPAGVLEPITQPPDGPAQPTEASLARQLVTQVIQAGGVLEVSAEDDRAHIDKLVEASRRAPNLPFGKQLRIRTAGSYWSSRREIYFEEDFSVKVATRPVPVSQRVAVYHPAVAVYRADPDWQGVSRQSLGRASRILQAIAAEAERRGYTVTDARRISHGFTRSRRADGHLRVAIDGFEYTLRIREQSAPGGKPMPYTASRSIPLWMRTRRTEFVPTGKLQVSIGDGYRRDSRPAEFRDTTRNSLEDRLPLLFRELEIRVLEDDHHRQERAREAEDRRRRWEQAMEQARHGFREASRAEELTRQVQQWRLAEDLDAYLSQMRATVSQIAGEEERVAAERWLTWVTEYRQSVDPLRQPLRMPPDVEPRKEDLKPYLDGWSPYGPG